MRYSFNHILFAFGLTLTLSAGFSAVYAQDAGFPVSESYEPESSDDVTAYSPGEGEPRNIPPKTTVVSPAPKDSTSLSGKPLQRASKSSADTSKNVAKPEQESTSKQEKKDDDDSVLSFNFLYYIFQKYKLQDIVD
jgi:hypothetical protein